MMNTISLFIAFNTYFSGSEVPSDIVKELDPVAFRCMVADEFSNLLEEQAVEINGELYYKNEVENE